MVTRNSYRCKATNTYFLLTTGGPDVPFTPFKRYIWCIARKISCTESTLFLLCVLYLLN